MKTNVMAAKSSTPLKLIAAAVLACFGPLALFASLASAQTSPLAMVDQTNKPDKSGKSDKPESIEVKAKRESEGAGSLGLDSTPQTASRLGLSARETPASIDVIDRETLLTRGQYYLREVIQSTVGITYIGSGGNGNSALSLRGFTGQSSVVQLLDGTRMYVGSGTSTLVADTSAFERIEVLRGPASVLFGDSAIGGAINYVSKKPSFDSARELLLSYGAYNTTQLSFGSAGALSERMAYRADISRQASNGYVTRADYERLTFSGALLFQVNRNLSLTLAANVLRNDDAPYWGTPLINGQINEALRRQNYNIEDSTIRYEDDFVRVKADWKPSAAWSVKNELYQYKSDRHWRNLENYTFQPALNIIRRTGYLEIFHDLQQSGNRTEISWDGNTGVSPQILPLRLVMGAEFNRIDFKNTNNAPFTGTSDVPLSGFTPGGFINVAGTRLGANSVTDQRAVFAEGVYSLTRDIKLVAGVRKETFDVDANNAQTNLRAQKQFSPFTWRLGAVVIMTPTLSLYGQLSTAVDPITGLLTLSPANAAFDLARGKQVELGLKQTFAQGMGDWTFALYNIKKTNILSRDPANPALTQQIGQQSSRGVEIALALRPAAGWQIEANVSVLNAKFDRFNEIVSGVAISRAGNLPPNVPERVANLWLTKQLSEAWKAGLGLRSVADRFANNANTLLLGGYQTADAYVSWSHKNLNISLRGRNLSNKLYAITPYNSGSQLYLSEPRSAEISLRYQF